MLNRCECLESKLCMQVKPFDSRAKFDPEHFANQYSLGGPLATFYFKAENQDSVKEASKTLTLP